MLSALSLVLFASVGSALGASECSSEEADCWTPANAPTASGGALLQRTHQESYGSIAEASGVVLGGCSVGTAVANRSKFLLAKHARKLGDAPMPDGLGKFAALDARGFLDVTSACCPEQMESFFNRLLDSLGHRACSNAHIQGLMHWFACVPNMDFNYLSEVIANGNQGPQDPCKYWAPKGQACPVLSPKCAGCRCEEDCFPGQVFPIKNEAPIPAFPTEPPVTAAPVTEPPVTEAPAPALFLDVTTADQAKVHALSKEVHALSMLLADFDFEREAPGTQPPVTEAPAPAPEILLAPSNAFFKGLLSNPEMRGGV